MNEMNAHLNTLIPHLKYLGNDCFVDATIPFANPVAMISSQVGLASTHLLLLLRPSDQNGHLKRQILNCNNTILTFDKFKLKYLMMHDD